MKNINSQIVLFLGKITYINYDYPSKTKTVNSTKIDLFSISTK